MNNNSPLALHEKLKQIRTSKGISQFSLGGFLGRNTMFVSRLESGEAKIDTDILHRIRKFLELETAPLLDDELAVYKSRLWLWRDVINANRIEEAQNMQGELSVIQCLPYEQDLIIMYQMIESRLLCKLRDMAAAEQRIKSATLQLGAMSIDARHLYHYTTGFFYFLQTVLSFEQTLDSDPRSVEEILSKALEHFTLALDFEKQSIGLNKDATLLALVGNTYIGLGKPVRALSSLEKSLATYSGDYVNGIRKMGASIAACHFQIGDYEQAKKILEEILVYERAENNNTSVGIILSDLALTKLMLGSYEEALKQCEDAFAYVNDNKLVYLICLSCKVKIMMKMKKTAEAKTLVAEGKELAVGENEIVGVAFESFGHLMSLNSDKSLDYLENTAIPCLRGTPQNHLALEICDNLEEHYRKKRLKIKSLAMAALRGDIYRDMIAFGKSLSSISTLTHLRGNFSQI